MEEVTEEAVVVITVCASTGVSCLLKPSRLINLVFAVVREKD